MKRHSGVIKLYSWNMELLCEANYSCASERKKWMTTWKERHPTAYYFVVTPHIKKRDLQKVALPRYNKKRYYTFDPKDVKKIIRPKSVYDNQQIV
jgi:hypothetical protein